MDEWLDLKAIVAGLALLALGWIGRLGVDRFRTRRDGNAAESWLRTNTRDEPEESHRTVSDIAKSLGLSEDRVNKAVARNRRIYRSREHVDQLSVWRQEPQGVYESRGVRRV